ncbi:MAG TPA: DNA polymerase III subunit gamma/tau [Clostridiales bacterium]|jgi:DNA polymerase-3 subunit gamma/tau|nr:DNA polymerase III subunit gamma/tau [Clostridiales bacterium]
MYQALYRKWRPRTFDDVVGQDSVVETLKRQVVLGRLSHAYLFTGTRGTGKTTCAKIFSRAVNCESPVEGNPCNKCPSCIGIENGSILDVVEMDAASNNGINDVRALRDEAIYSPAAVRKRVYIIDEVHMLSKDAFNALLKIMEEPPEHLMFILATTELYKVPATVLSRCQRFTFKRLPPDRIAERLVHIASKEGLKLTEEAAELLARLADGSMRDGISFLDQCSSAGTITAEHVRNAIGLAGRLETERLLRSVISGNAAEALTILDRLYSEGKDVAAVLDELCALQRDILLTKIAPKGGWGLQSGGYEIRTLKELASLVTAQRLMSDIGTVQSKLSTINAGGNRKVVAELCLMQLCRVDELESSAPKPLEKEPVKKPKAKPESSPEPVPEQITASAPETAAQPIVEENKPEDKPQPIQQSAVSDRNRQGDSRTWDDILSATESRLNPIDFMVLNDPTNAEGEIQDGTVIIRAKSPFHLITLDKKEIKAAVKAVAEDLLGRTVRVVVTDAAKKAEVFEDKLDALSKFENIKFK